MTGSLGTTDHPVTSIAEDLLDRRGFAELIAADLRALDASKGAVVGLFGPWGIGKTSLLNMVREQLANDPPLPVVFSGTGQ